jgi:ABC-type glycerol-3-phosphate transport system substrate-binding protein
LKIERRLSGRVGRPNKVHKKLSHGIYAFLFFLVLIPAFSGCGKGRDINMGAAASPELLIMLRMEEHFQAENNPYIRRLEEILNIKLNLLCPSPSNYNERLDVMMTMGDLPDIVQLNWTGEANLSKWAQSGLIRAINLEKAPNIEFNVPRSLLSLMRVLNDGQIYAVPGITSRYPYGVAIRKDWLDTLGLETPRSLDDFLAVMKQFTYDDPDRNGKHDTWGITSYRLNHIGGVFAGSFQTDYFWNSIHPDPGDPQQKINLREKQHGYPEFLEFCRQIYALGYLDPNFSNLQNGETQFVLGKTGMIGAYSNNIIRLEEQFRITNPDARLEWILCPGDYEGRVWNFLPESYGNNGPGSMYGQNALFFISKDADYDSALFFLDQMNTKEMIQFSNLGIQGIHYESFDYNRGILFRTREQANAVFRDLFGVSDTFRREVNYFLGSNAEENNRLEYYRKKGYLLITSPSAYNMSIVQETINFQLNHPNYKEFERSCAIKYIKGEITRNEYIELTAILENEKSILSKIINERYQRLVSGVSANEFP